MLVDSTATDSDLIRRDNFAKTAAQSYLQLRKIVQMCTNLLKTIKIVVHVCEGTTVLSYRVFSFLSLL